MYLQVVNNSLGKFNQIRTTKATLFNDVKKQGWQMGDCKISEIKKELVDTKYRGADGKNIPSGQKQYKTRATSRGNLNKKTVHIDVKNIVAATVQ